MVQHRVSVSCSRAVSEWDSRETGVDTASTTDLSMFSVGRPRFQVHSRPEADVDNEDSDGEISPDMSS